MVNASARTTTIRRRRDEPSWTEPSQPAESVLLPRRCTLDGFAEAVSRAGGVGLLDLGSITRLVVRTENSLYRIIVLEPPDAKILVQGGQFFAETTEGRLGGSSFGGNFLKLAWIGFGLRMEIYSDGRRIVTSPVRSIQIEDDGSLPGPF